MLRSYYMVYHLPKYTYDGLFYNAKIESFLETLQQICIFVC